VAEVSSVQALDRQLCFALYAASRAMTRAYAPLLQNSGLTYPQYLVMLVLWELDGEPAAVGAVGERLHLDSGTLTPMLKRLETLGFVSRRRDPSDERRVLIAATEAGARLRAELLPVPQAMVRRFDLDVAQIEQLRDQLVALTATLET
jgi:DNA-binding MarR family transcriptional regulator